MAPEKPPAPHQAQEHQDESIKARKTQLFEVREHVEVVTLQPFKEYVRLTPPAPLSQGVKAGLWAAGVVVVLLLLAALFIGPPPRKHRRAAGPPGRPAVAAGFVVETAAMQTERPRPVT